MKIYTENGFVKFSQKISAEKYVINMAHVYFNYSSYSKNCQGAYMMATNKPTPDFYSINFDKSFISKGKFLTKINIKFEDSSLSIPCLTTRLEDPIVFAENFEYSSFNASMSKPSSPALYKFPIRIGPRPV